MLRLKMALAILALLVSSLACATIMGEDLPATDIPDQAPPAVEVPPTEEAISCPLISDRIMQVATSGIDGGEENLLDSEITLVTYAVSGDQIGSASFENVPSTLRLEQQDSATQAQVWNYFAGLIPPGQREMLSEYSVITDGKGGTLAAVSQTEADASQWSLQVDIADSAEYDDLTFTLIHEFGHLLTLGPAQVPPDLAVFNDPDNNNTYLKELSACPQYFPGEGCANPDSYINAFYTQFWADIHDEWNAINLEQDNDIYTEKLDKFYQKYRDQFVTDYAPTNPEEDIAESWAFFVLGRQPSGDTIAGQKVLFFSQYPELVQLRGQILRNLCGSFPG